MKDRSLLQQYALLVGAAFLVVGILGFIPGITTNVGDMSFAGDDSPSELFGLFQVSVLHNLVHLAFGVAGLALGWQSWDGARAFLYGAGAIYLVLWLYGLIVDQTSGWNFVPFDSADDWLHFGLGIAMLGGGIVLAYREPHGPRHPTERIA